MKKKFIKLFESASDQNKVEMDTSQEQRAISDKSKHFNFDCGVFMAKIDFPMDNKFGLSYHYNKTNSVEEFIESVRAFLKIVNHELTENDIERLKTEYSKI